MTSDTMIGDTKRASARRQRKATPPSLPIRPARLADLDALVAIEEECFAGDLLSRRSFRGFIGSPRAILRVLEIDGLLVGYGLTLLRKGTAAARLYSLAVGKSARGKGLGARLLTDAEQAAYDANRAVIRLESRVDNDAANGLYRRAGYRPVAEIKDYYEDGSAAVRMEKLLRGDAKPKHSPPYFEQSTEFTCGPACLMMAIAGFCPDFKLDEDNEIRLWRQATTIFMSSGIGGCEPYGLAVTCAEYGLKPEIFVNVRGPLLLQTVKNEEKRRVMKVAQKDFRRRAENLAIPVHFKHLPISTLAKRLNDGAVAIVLISGNTMFGKRVPHWVLVFDYDGRNVFIHDPWVEEESFESATDATNIPIPIAELDRMSRWGKAGLRAAIVITSSRT